MLCDHLRELETALHAAGFQEVFRGKAWSDHCREWVYYDCILALAPLRAKFHFAPCVHDHIHRGTHDGSEAGFVCTEHEDAIMGLHPTSTTARTFEG